MVCLGGGFLWSLVVGSLGVDDDDDDAVLAVGRQSCTESQRWDEESLISRGVCGVTGWEGKGKRSQETGCRGAD